MIKHEKMSNVKYARTQTFYMLNLKLNEDFCRDLKKKLIQAKKNFKRKEVFFV